MATVIESLSERPQPTTWLKDFLREELAPYPGRATLVARMVIASTFVMILSMTFQLPFGAYGAIYALTISRESTHATIEEVKIIIIAYILSGSYVLLGAILFAGEPLPRFVWVVATFFLLFLALRTWTNYTAAARFGYLVVITVPLWDRHVRAGVQVEDTLWAVGTISLASIITVVLEIIFAQLKPSDDLVQSIAERLACVEQVLDGYTAEYPVSQKTRKGITRMSILGTSRLRRILQRSSYLPQYAEQMGAVVALTGRLVDLAANLPHLEIHLPADDDRKQIRSLVETIETVRADLLNDRTPRPVGLDSETETAPGIPLLREMKRTVSLIPEVFTGSHPLSAYGPSPSPGDRSWRPFVPDALSNPEHIKFALRGCFAASLCYMIYNGLDWAGISTAVTTCFLTALSTIGSSRQKQVLRFAGAIAGGVVMGFGAQIFILPSLDSIWEFTLLYAVVITVSAWFATSGPRLSYFGVQIAVAFCLINLQEFKFQTSLSVARDRVVGIFLGLIVMWAVFDQMWGTPAAAEMKKTFISALRLLADFAREPLSKDLKAAIERSFALRESINKAFNTVRASADSVLFEFGSSRQQDLALRSQIVQWQPQLRSIFVTRIVLFKYRLNLPGFELPETVRAAQQEFDEWLAQMLDSMADRIEGKTPRTTASHESPIGLLGKTIQTVSSEDAGEALAGQLHTFLSLSRNMEALTISLDKAI